VEYIAVENLNVGDLKVRVSIDDDIPSIELLATGFCIKASTVQKYTKCCLRWDANRRGCKLFVVVDGLDLRSNISKLWK
jgi:hypothetical protein